MLSGQFGPRTGRAHRTSAALLLVGMTVAALLAACVQQAPGEAPAAPESKATAVPKAEGTPAAKAKGPAGDLQVAIYPVRASFDTGQVNSAASGIFYWPGFDGLTWLDRDGNLQPGLASEWSTSDGKRWAFTLGDGVSFHDGTPVTAEDVIRTFRFYQDPDNGAVNSSLFLNTTFSSPDERTVVLEVEDVQPALPKLIALAMVLKGRDIDPGDPEALTSYFADGAVGTGPYRLARFEPNSVLEYEAMPADFGSPRGQASAGTLRFNSIPERSSRVAALLAGDLHMAYDLGFDVGDQVESAGFLFQSIPGTAAAHLSLNTADGPTADIRVRQALNYAVDREAIIDSLFAGLTEPDGQLLSEAVLGFNPSIEPVPHDLDRAKELMAEAGYEDGFDLGTLYVYDPVFPTIQAEAIQSAFQAIGVTTDLASAERAKFIEEFYAPAGQRDGLWGYTINWEQTFEANSVYRWWSSDTPSDRGRRWEDPEFDALYQAAKTTLDPEQRDATYQEMVQYFHSQYPVVFLWYTTHTMAIDGERVVWDTGNFTADMFTGEIEQR